MFLCLKFHLILHSLSSFILMAMNLLPSNSNPLNHGHNPPQSQTQLGQNFFKTTQNVPL